MKVFFLYYVLTTNYKLCQVYIHIQMRYHPLFYFWLHIRYKANPCPSKVLALYILLWDNSNNSPLFFYVFSWVIRVFSNSQGLLYPSLDKGAYILRRLVYSHKGLINPVNEFLEMLAQIIIRRFHIVTIFYVFFPEPPRPDNYIG